MKTRQLGATTTHDDLPTEPALVLFRFVTLLATPTHPLRLLLPILSLPASPYFSQLGSCPWTSASFLSLALFSSRTDDEAVVAFSLILEWQGSPEGRGKDGRPIEWEWDRALEEKGLERVVRCKAEWERAKECLKHGGSYETPTEIYDVVEQMHDENESEKVQEEAREKRRVASIASQAGQSQSTSKTSRLPSSNSSASVSAGASTSRLPSRGPAPPPSIDERSTKRPRTDNTMEEVDMLDDYQEADSNTIPPQVGVPKTDLSSLVGSNLMRSSSPKPGSSTTAPLTKRPPFSVTIIKVSRLPSWITTPIFEFYLANGPTAFATETNPSLLSSYIRHAPRRRPHGKPPPVPLKFAISSDGVDVTKGEYPTARVEFANWSDAWAAKELFDNEKVCPKVYQDPRLVWTLLL